MAVCQGKMNEINWFWVCLHKFMKAKSYFDNLLVVVIRNGCGLLGLQTLRSIVFQEPIDEMSWFFVCWYKFRKAKSYYNIYQLSMLKKRWGFRDHETLKSGVSHKWFDEVSTLIEWFLCTESYGYLLKLPKLAILGWHCLA